MNEAWLCKDCSSVLSGRRDRKFCSDACRVNFHNQKNRDALGMVRMVNRMLLRNRSVLAKLFHAGITEVSATQLELDGYQRNWNTGIASSTSGITQIRIYEYILCPIGNDLYRILKDESSDSIEKF